jgi:hypothetical protein
VAGIPEFGRWIIFTYRAKPNPDKFTFYSDNVDLASDIRLLGPFDFNQTLTRSRQVVGAEIWAHLCDDCMGRGIVSPKMNSRTRERGVTSSVFKALKKRQANRRNDNDNPTLENDGPKKVWWTLADLAVDANSAPMELLTFPSDA